MAIVLVAVLTASDVRTRENLTKVKNLQLHVLLNEPHHEKTCFLYKYMRKQMHKSAALMNTFLLAE